MLDVLLIMVPPYIVEMPPLGISYLCQYLQDNGFTAQVLDLNIFFYRRMNAKRFWAYRYLSRWGKELNSLVSFQDIKAAVDEIINRNPKLVGFSLTRYNVKFSLTLAAYLKRRNRSVYIAVGGYFINTLSSVLLKDLFKNNSQIDFIVMGEGEKTLVRLMGKLKNNPLSISRKIFREPEHLDLNSIPMLRLDKLGLNLKTYSYKKYTGKVYPIMCSRGCGWRCAYCNEYNIWKTFRQREIDNVIEEIKYNVKKGRCRFWFAENSMNVDMKWLDELVSQIIKKKLDIKWMSSFMIRKELLKGNFMKKLRKSGCFAINYSVDSGSDYILKMIRKPYTASLAAKVLKKTKEAGIKNLVSFLVGFPGEKEKDFRETIRFVVKNKDYIDLVPYCSKIYLQFLSDIYRRYINYGIIYFHSSYWIDFNGLDLAQRVARQKLLSNVIRDNNIAMDRNLLF